MTRNPYQPREHSTQKTPLVLKRLSWPRRALRAALLWLAGIVQGHPVWPSPLEQFFALEDAPNRVYVWTFRKGTTDKEAEAMAAAFAEEFKDKFHRETKALHIMTPDVEVVSRLSKPEAERYLLPWLKAEE